MTGLMKAALFSRNPGGSASLMMELSLSLSFSILSCHLAYSLPDINMILSVACISVLSGAKTTRALLSNPISKILQSYANS